MRKGIVFLLFVLSIGLQVKASHILGGEITWKCLSDGKFQFYMSVYRDCEGIDFGFVNQTLDIVGSPLPKDSAGSDIVSIVLKPDSTRWQNSRFGETSPNCTPEYGFNYKCASEDAGTVQEFFYFSDPIELNGVPPHGGWTFFWQSPCCRSLPNRVQNVNTSGTFQGNMLLRASMYPTKANTKVNPCMDSSPQFRSLPVSIACRASMQQYDPVGIDPDLDSLVFSWDRPYNDPIESPIALPYKAGFNFNNPTDDQSFDSLNVPASLNPVSGLIKMAVHSGFGSLKYIVVIRLDSYREGRVIASVFREVPLTVFDCPPFPNSQRNYPPLVYIDGQQISEYSEEFFAGQKVSIPILVEDRDSTGVGSQRQNLTFVPEGLLMTNDKASNGPLVLNNPRGQGNIDITPSAFFQNVSPTLDISKTPNVYTIRQRGEIRTEFVWQTDCKHLPFKQGAVGTNEQFYQFTFRAEDDHCPIPAYVDGSIRIKLKEPLALEAPFLLGASVTLEGLVKANWVAPLDSIFSFKKYELEYATPAQGAKPLIYKKLSETNQYQQMLFGLDLKLFQHLNQDTLQEYNLLDRPSNTDWYLRMATYSGCYDTLPPLWSEAVSVMELEAGLVSGTPSTVRLNWNSATTGTSSIPAHWKYQSKRKYYIWATDSISNGGLKDVTSWYIAGQSDTTQVLLPGLACNGTAAYRIEARDTIVTLKQGSTSQERQYDTLYFSTFSTIDTAKAEFGQPVVYAKDWEYLGIYNRGDSYQWLDMNRMQAIPFANTSTYIPLDTGKFAVLMQKGTCSDTSAVYVVQRPAHHVQLIDDDSLVSSVLNTSHQWFDCGKKEVIQGANAVSHVTAVNGSFATIIDLFGFKDTSNCVLVSGSCVTFPKPVVLSHNSEYLKSSVTGRTYKWRNCTTGAFLSTDSIFTPDQTGNYQVIVERRVCRDTSNCFKVLPYNKEVLLYNSDSLVSSEEDSRYRWIDCEEDTLILGVTSKHLILSDTGYYAVILKKYDLLQDTSDCIPVLAIGLSDIDWKKSIRIYPNPTEGKTSIYLNKDYQNLELIVRNIHGQVLQQQSFSQKISLVIDLQGAPGIYFIELRNEAGETANWKVVKQ